MKTLRILSLFLFLPASLWAQIPPDSTAPPDRDPGMDHLIEDAIIDVQTDDQTDWTIYTDQLKDLEKKPLNLNTASREELLMIPGITELHVNQLHAYIVEFGPLTSVYELQAVPGFDARLFADIKNYVTVRESREKDIREENQHPAGPGLGEMLGGLRGEWLNRFSLILEEQKGYTAPDTNSDGSLTTRYAGSALKAYSRFRLRYEQNLSIALVVEKDAGEAMRWDPATGNYGFDFMAGHFFLKDFGRLKRLVIGDYNIQVGQGLTLSSGLGFGKGSESVSSVKRTQFGIRPYASVNENQFMRGAAATYAFGPVYVTGFFSRIGRDGNISALDTLTDDVQVISTLQTSGLHRTDSEIEDKDAIREMLFGGRLEYKKRTLMLGLSQFWAKYDANLVPSGRDYQLFNFTGDRNMITSVDWDWTVRNLNFFGEAARSQSGGTAVAAGMLASLDPRLEASLLFRNFERDFHSFRAFAFAERPTAVQNERGMYLGLKGHPSTRWTFSAYYDMFTFPWHRFNISYPSRGHEYLTQVDYHPNRDFLLYLRFRSDTKEQNASELPDGQQLEILVPVVRKSLRLHFQKKISREIRIKSRAEYSWYNKGDTEAYNGFLIFQDLVWQPGFKWKFTGRFAVFDIPDYDARIYAYESDVPGFFNIPAYSGLGSRYYLMVNYQPVRNLEFWLRFARTRYQHDNTIGSGLNEIQGDTRSEVRLQVKVTF